MATRNDPGENLPPRDIEPDIDFTGYDPYIVAITGGAVAPFGNDPATLRHPTTESQATESRKVKLMAWLREHGT